MDPDVIIMNILSIAYYARHRTKDFSYIISFDLKSSLRGKIISPTL